jgi:SPP1 family predicted phage head-tail adaptor
MDRSGVINLISVVRQQDDYGQWQKVETAKQVYCQVHSVSQKEFFEGGRNGLNPEYKFTVFFADYNNEPIVEYNGERFSVYRTFLSRTDKLELYVERKGGTNA